LSDDVGTLLELIGRLDDVVHEAKPLPLTDQVRLDKDEVYAILDGRRSGHASRARRGRPHAVRARGAQLND
jgi:hypothetical protein